MKSYLFTTDDGRGGVILCDIDTMEDVVPYLQQRFKGVVRVEQGHSEWTVDGGFAEFTPVPVTQALVNGEADGEVDGEARVSEPELKASPNDPEKDSMTGSLF